MSVAKNPAMSKGGRPLATHHIKANVQYDSRSFFNDAALK